MKAEKTEKTTEEEEEDEDDVKACKEVRAGRFETPTFITSNVGDRNNKKN